MHKPARTTRVTLRLTLRQIDALKERAQSAGIPFRTWIQQRLVDLCKEGPDVGAVLREVQKGNLLTTRLWLATAQDDATRAVILRIAQGVEAAVSSGKAAGGEGI